MSKYHKNRTVQSYNKSTYTWQNFAPGINAPTQITMDDNLEAEKERIEAIPLEKLSFTDVYTFPFKNIHTSWVYDSQDNFIFEFCTDSKQTREKFLSILNNTVTDYNRHDARYVDGFIELKHLDEWVRFILIRGWGSLTSNGGYNLSGEYASKIQDSLAEYIIDKLK